jgi:hypothetical protein
LALQEGGGGEWQSTFQKHVGAHICMHAVNVNADCMTLSADKVMTEWRMLSNMRSFQLSVLPYMHTRIHAVRMQLSESVVVSDRRL